MSTIVVTADYVVPAMSNVVSDGGSTTPFYAYAIQRGVGSPALTFTDLGSISVTSSLASAQIEGLHYTNSTAATDDLIHIAAGATLAVNATGAGSTAYGYNDSSTSPRFENDGTITVSATATGVGAAFGGSQGGAANTGSISVQANVATGVLARGAEAFANTGTVTATGQTSATAFDMAVILGTSLDNSGTISASASGTSTAIHITGHYQTASPYPVFYAVTNSGAITAQYALVEADTTATPQTPRLFLANTGTITGQIVLGSGPPTASLGKAGGALIYNSGAINGAIHLDANGNDLYDGRGGTQTGGIYLGGGTDLLFLGADGETVQGGTGAAMVFGGAGADTITGGSAADVLNGGGGNDTLTGGLGADTFLVTATTGHAVITDFSHAQGDKIDLSALTAFTNLAYVTAHAVQQGADTVITLGSGDLTLSNVQLANLTAADFTFAGSYASIQVSTPSLVLSGTRVFSGSNGGTGAYSLTGTAMKVQGDLLIQDSLASDTLVGITGASTASVLVDTGAAFLVSATGAGATARGFSNVTVSNKGLVDISATGAATGVSGGLNNWGSWTIRSAGGVAIGIDNATFVVNSTSLNAHASIAVSGQTAFGVKLSGANNPSLSNEGSITATASGGHAYGVVVGPASSGQVLASINNQGSISAEYAVVAGADLTGTSGLYDLILSNSGTIDGIMLLGADTASVTNTGAIHGAIHFNSTWLDEFDGRGGTQSGGIYLSAARATVHLGDDGETVYGGSGALSLTGGAGADWVSAGGANDAIDGGGGIDTISYQTAASGVVVSLAAQGAAQNTGGGGVDTLSNFENLIGSAFNDRLTGDANSNILTGGAGADTFVASGGVDTITDFSHAQGDKIDLSAFGQFASLADVLAAATQSGADTVIDLGGGASVTLQGVTRSALTAGDFGFSTALSSPITVTGGYVVASTDNLTLDNSALSLFTAYVLQGTATPPNITFTDQGTVNVTSSRANATVEALWDSNVTASHTDLIHVASGATLSTTATGSGSIAFGFAGHSNVIATIVNDGAFTTSAVAQATGAYLFAGGDFTNNGQFTVSAATAVGVLLSGAGDIVNTGIITVTGQTSAYAFDIRDDYSGSFTNSGTITATGSSVPTAIQVSYLAASPPTGVQYHIANSGVIWGAVSVSGGSPGPLVNLTNTGTIHGDVTLDRGSTANHAASGYDNEIHNQGAIVGNVLLSNHDHDLYDGRGGTISGIVTVGDGASVVYLGDEGETVQAMNTGSNAGSQITGGAGADHITAGAGDDTIDGGGGDDILNGGAGTNTVSYASAAGGVTVSLAAQGSSQYTVGAGFDTLSNFQNLTGSAFNDTLLGNAGANVLDGGGGINTVSYSGATAGVTVSLALQGSAQNTGGAGSDTLSNFQNLTGSGFNDTLTGDSGDNVITGGAGNDVLDGGGGVNTVSYGNDSFTGAVTVNLGLQGQAQNTGGAGTDTLSHFQNIIGSAYADTLTGDGNNNVLTGGTGADRFVATGGADTITDFSHAQGDRIDLSAFSQFTNITQVLAAAVQSGSDTVINLGGGASLTLQNVSKSALTAQDFFKPTPIASTVNVTGNYVVSSDQYLSYTGTGAAYRIASPTTSIPSFTDQGRIEVSSATANQTVQGFSDDGGMSSSLIKIAAGGYLSVTATGAGSSAYGYKSVSWGDLFRNDGVVLVSAVSQAVGVYQYQPSSSAAHPGFVNTGQFTVSANSAYGAQANYAGYYVNSGQMEIDGVALGVAFDLSQLSVYAGVTNSGTITVSGTSSYGIRVGGNAPSSILTVVNSGTITAQHAIYETTVSSSPSVHLTNSGTINGDIVLTAAATSPPTSGGSWTVNTGAINGAIHFNGGGGYVYDGRGGTQAGGIILGGGLATAYLGDDGETVTGGTNTIAVFGGAGADAIIGSSKADLISGGSGSDTLTGGLGADVFWITSANGAEVITDFSHAQGDRIDLTPLGTFTSLADVQAHAAQSGADTVISLGSGSLTLRNVVLGNLTAADFVFASSYTTTQVTSVNNATVTVTGVNVFNGVNALGGYQVIGNSFNAILANSGVMLFESSQAGVTVVGASTSGAANAYPSSLPSLLVNYGADFLVTATGAGANAYGIKGGSNGGALTNHGVFTVSATGTAVGIASSGLAGILNDGMFTVSGNVAHGVDSGASGWSAQANLATMTITGVQSAVGFNLGVVGYDTLNNSGVITVTASAGSAYGVLYSGLFSLGNTLELNNAGVITAQYAVYGSNSGSPDQTPQLNLTNTGTINGQIILGQGPSSVSAMQYSNSYSNTIYNNGAIVGDVHLSGNGNDLYDARISSNGAPSGTLTGGLYLGAGTDTVYLGDEGETVYGGTGTAIVLGGAGNDTISGGSGADILNGGAGSNVLTGGAGADTFKFTVAGGSATITDFSHAQGDKIDLTNLALFGSFAAVQAAAVQSGADTVISLGGGASITLQNILKSSLTSADFVLNPLPITGAYTVSNAVTWGIDGSAPVYAVTFATVTISGSISISSSAGAVGMTGVYTAGSGYMGMGASTVTNTGSFTVSAASDAIGFAFANGTLTNSGTISVTSSGGSATAIQLSGPDYVTVVNNASGTITGQTALAAVSGSLNLTNYGTINGAISLAYSSTITNAGVINGNIVETAGSSIISNSGTINGAVVVADHNNRITNTGTIAGAVTLGSGTDTLDSHSGTITGVVNAGTGSNTVTLGAEDNTVLSGVGFGARVIDGGGGVNTISYANATSNVIVSLAAQGSAQNTNFGTDTLTNFQKLIGSAYADTLTAANGTSTLTGGAGGDTFKLLSSADVTTITDFSHAQGDRIVLNNVPSLNSLADIQAHAVQSGADTVITLGSGSLTLKNVLLSSLTAADFAIVNTYNTISVSNALTVAAGQTVNLAGLPFGGYGAYELYGSSLTILGTVNAVDGGVGDSLSGLHGQGSLKIGAGGTMTVATTGSFSPAYGAYFNAQPASFENDGTFSVSSAGSALGVDMALGGSFLNAGAMTVTGASAQGVYGGPGTTLTNAGNLTVTGGSAQGVSSWYFGGGTLNNSGTITATNTAGGHSIGMLFGDRQGGVETVTNSGTITADYAFEAVSNVADSTYLTNLNLTNTGAINGQVLLGAGSANTILNTGAINGEIHLGTSSVDTYDGRGGTQAGGVWLGGGFDTVYLGNDGETVHTGSGAAAVFGGTGADTIVGGAQASRLDGGGGNDTLTGGAGSDQFVLRPGDGHDTVTNFDHAQGDRIDLSAFHLARWSDLQSHISQSGGDTVITFGSDTLTLQGFTGTLAQQDVFLGQVPQDFNGDHYSDLIFRDPISGAWGYAAFDGSDNPIWHAKGASDPTYAFVGKGDFNADGYVDILVRNLSTGAWGYQAMDNAGNGTWNPKGASDPAYAFVGVGDFNGDGYSDILVRNLSTGAWGYQTMGVSGNGTWNPEGASDPTYAFVGVGDFNGDGYSDILVRNLGTGAWGYQAMTASGPGTWHPEGASDPTYAFVGTGDFNGDGFTDILVRNLITGAWGYQAMVPMGSGTWHPQGIASPDYAIVGTGDFNGDGVTDLVSRNNANGAWGYVAMDTAGTGVWHPLPLSNASYIVL